MYHPRHNRIGMTGVTVKNMILLHFIRRRPDGEIFEDTHSGQPVHVTLVKKQISPAFEDALIGKTEGETITVTLPPEKAYGKYRKILVVTIKRKNFILNTNRSLARSSGLRSSKNPV